MKENLVKRITNFITQHKQKNRWKQVVTVMAALVVFATTYSLILPAITMTGTATGSNCETSSNAATGSNGGGSFGSNGFFTATGSNANAASGSNTLVQTPSDAILYRCGLDEHFHDDTCYDADDELICDFEEHEHVEQCYYPEEFTVEMIELMDIFASEIGKLPDLEVVNEYKILEAKELFDEADALLAEEMGINLEDGTLPYEVVEVMIGTALESYTAAMDLFIEEYPELTADDFDAILAGDYVYGPAYKTLLEFIEVWYGAVTLATAEERVDDIGVVQDDGIKFGIYNYSLDINKNANRTDWRTISPYFAFRNSKMDDGTVPSDTVHIPTNNAGGNATYDVDGYTANHATVERILVKDNPVLNLKRTNAEGNTVDPNVSEETRSLAYLFSEGDYAVSAYEPTNTILQKDRLHYWYDSKECAVDYDTENQVFRVRSYTERSDTTAGYDEYSDFHPFTYTNGEKKGTNSSTGADYHMYADTTTVGPDADYWYGMTMEFDFVQTEDGQIVGDDGSTLEDMVFNFSGDDDVWVFVDDVLVLDLGGTHGTVTGSINFATGQILQYLSWQGANNSVTSLDLNNLWDPRLNGSETSFPTTLRKCFDSATYTDAEGNTQSMVPNGGWHANGKIFSNNTKHTLKFFYLERGAAVANCKIDFRLLTLPDKSLTVTKELIDGKDASLDTFIRDSLTYKFRVMKADDEGNATEEFFVEAGEAYTILENGAAIDDGTVADDGTFELKAGQSARFTKMLDKGDGAKTYVVQEIMPSELTGQYSGVEYNVGSTEGETKTGTNPPTGFSTYDTNALSAEETQTVIYRNKVDSSALGKLRISKILASGATLPADQVFEVNVELGGVPLAVGTTYAVDEAGQYVETRIVESQGRIKLKLDETATITKGIISGTTYEVSEIEGDGYNPSYSGIVTNLAETEETGTVSCNVDGASGTFPLASIVHITVANANYDFAVNIPISKTCLDNIASNTFGFEVESGTWDDSDNTWSSSSAIPGTNITVTNAELKNGEVVIGFVTGEEGTYQFKISEKNNGGYFIYDSDFYIVKVDVRGGVATVSNIKRNGTENIEISAPIAFVNRSTTVLTVTKKVEGTVSGSDQIAFPFEAAITLDDEPFTDIPETASGNYEVKDNVISFSLKDGESIEIPYIPVNAKVVVKEVKHDGFITYCEVAGRDSAEICTDSATVEFSGNPITVNFTNYAGQELPSTGGIGTFWCTFSGLLLVATAMMFGFVQKRRRERRAN